MQTMNFIDVTLFAYRSQLKLIWVATQKVNVLLCFRMRALFNEHSYDEARCDNLRVKLLNNQQLEPNVYTYLCRGSEF